MAVPRGRPGPLPGVVLADVGVGDEVGLDAGEAGEVGAQRLRVDARRRIGEARDRVEDIGDGQRAGHLHRLAVRLGGGEDPVGLGPGHRHLLGLDIVVEAGVIALVVVDEARGHPDSGRRLRAAGRGG